MIVGGLFLWSCGTAALSYIEPEVSTIRIGSSSLALLRGQPFAQQVYRFSTFDLRRRSYTAPLREIYNSYPLPIFHRLQPGRFFCTLSVGILVNQSIKISSTKRKAGALLARLSHESILGWHSTSTLT